MALTDGLLGFWNLDEESGVRVDASGNGRSLTDTNTVGFAAGQQGTAADFIRANSERLARTDTGLRCVGDCTLSAFIKPSLMSGGQAQYGSGIIAHMTGDAIGDYWLGLTDLGRVHFAHWESAGSDADGRARTTAIHVAEDTIVHLVGRRKAGVLSIWTDGVSRALDALLMTDSGWGTNGFNLGVNWIAGGSTYHFNGWIDLAGVWNRGVEDAEIAELFTGWFPGRQPALFFSKGARGDGFGKGGGKA